MQTDNRKDILFVYQKSLTSCTCVRTSVHPCDITLCALSTYYRSSEHLLLQKKHIYYKLIKKNIKILKLERFFSTCSLSYASRNHLLCPLSVNRQRIYPKSPKNCLNYLKSSLRLKSILLD